MTRNAIIRLKPSPEGFGALPDKLEPEMFESELPVQHSHEFFEDAECGVFIGVWDTGDMVEAAGPYAMDEFMLVLEGQALIRNNATGEKRAVNAGQAFVLPMGFDCQWQQHGYLKKFFMIFEPPGEDPPDKPALADIALLPDDLSHPRARPGSTPLFSGTDSAVNTEVYANTERTFCVGAWQSGTFRSGTGPLRHHLMGCIREGAIHLSDAVGQKHDFVAGDTFFVPAGTVCSASVAGNVHMYYCILDINANNRHDET